MSARSFVACSWAIWGNRPGWCGGLGSVAGMQNPDPLPDLLPETVLGAVRSAKQIKSDPTMANLRDKGFPWYRAAQGSATPLLP